VVNHPNEHRFYRKSLLALCLALVLCGSLATNAAAEPLGRWSLDEGSGQVAADRTGNGHDGRLGALPGADGNDPSWVSGRFGGALRFAADQDRYVVLRGPETLNPQQVSVSAWVRRLGTPGRWRYVVSNGAVGCEFASYGLYTGFGGGLAFYVSDNAHYVRAPEADQRSVWDGAWHHAVGTYDGQRVRFYLDGAEVGAGTATVLKIGYASPAPGAYIGTYRGSCNRPFTGDVDEINIHNDARSGWQVAADAARNAKRPMPPQTAPLSGPPAVGAPSRCMSITATPKRLVAGRGTRLALRVRRARKPVVGKRVVIRGLGVKRSVRTGRRGRARLTVRVPRSGKLKLRAAGQPRRCTRSVTVKKRR
jgi:Concanavalin A-like lectin/glucanases superfamily